MERDMILYELGRIDARLISVDSKLDTINKEVASLHSEVNLLKYKSSLWGALAGLTIATAAAVAQTLI